MKPQKLKDPSDDLAGGLGVIEQIERVLTGGVVHERHGQVAAERFGQESIDRLVQTRVSPLCG